MDLDLGGWLWFLLDVLATGILALAILVAYRSFQQRFEAPAARRSGEIDETQAEFLRAEAERQRLSRS